MRRRQGYTLVELLVAMALILLIMSILSAAYVQGLSTFSNLKAIGDMNEQLRMATTIMRRDLGADHFTGARRLSDPDFVTNPPREGFFRLINANGGGGGFHTEGIDSVGNSSTVIPYGGIIVPEAVHFSVKLRGNRMEDFFTSAIADQPAATFFNQPADAFYGSGYQWGEVAYYLYPQGQSTTGPTTYSQTQPLWSLYRAQRVVVANSQSLGAASANQATSLSISPAGAYNTPTSIVSLQNRGLQFPSYYPQYVAQGVNPISVDALLLSNVLSFTVLVMPTTTGLFQSAPYDSSPQMQSNPGYGLYAVQITIRIYDLKTKQSRQITVIQDL